MGSDVKITLPRDAEGREIPLDTTVLYDEKYRKMHVKRIEFGPFTKEWSFFIKGDMYAWNYNCPPQDVHLECPTPPDSWEKLLEDLDNASKGGDNAECLYMRGDGIESQCTECRLCVDESDLECAYLAYADIATRIRKLSGED